MSTFPINFQRRFAPPVRDGSKLQTIRRLRRDGRRPVPGDLLKLYTGLRTANVELLRTSVAQRIRTVRIDFEDGEIFLEGERLQGGDRAAFALADGFTSWPEMLAWFQNQYNEGGDVMEFDGLCIEWA